MPRLRRFFCPQMALLFSVMLAGFAVMDCRAVTAAEKPQTEKPQTPTAAQAKHFELHVRPLLAEHCLSCHGNEKQNGNLRLDSLAAMLAGGDTGPAIVRGKPGESLLVEAINYESYEMPPDGRLSDEQIAVLTDWINDGAPWPGSGDGDPQVVKRERISDEDRKYWAFQPVTDPAVPHGAGSGGERNAVDAFVAERQQSHGLTLAPEADRRVLIRRAYYDLIGLPPSREDIAAFVADDRPDAWERLIDRLLASPQYGEKWGRHWLDLVRYAESDGFRQDAYRPDAWRYRDYVVRAFNDDISYAQFVREQIAGDELAPEDADAVTATGLMRLGIYEYNQRDARTQRQDILNEITDVTGDVFLGMGLACARCHDHKFDPILQDDYFRLQAFFASTVWRDDVPAADASVRRMHQQRLTEWEAATADIRAELDQLLKSYVEGAERRAVKIFPPDVVAIMEKPKSERTAEEHQVAYLVERQALLEQEKYLTGKSKLKEADQKRREELEAKLAEFDHLRPAPLPTAMTTSDARPDPGPTFIPGKERRGEMPPGFPTVLGVDDPEVTPLVEFNSSGRRTALAEWMASPDNPVTNRVMVNRIWQQHFGRGIVSTTSDFGRLGELPSHPELLDWLVCRFVEQGRQLKPMHRLMMTSAVYRQSANHPRNEEFSQRDPENRWLWRRPVRRLEAEQIRDTLLAVSEGLDQQIGGPSVSGNTDRRALYVKILRNNRDPFLDAFDFADGFLSTAERNVTVTPTQSLLLMNGTWNLKLAERNAAAVWNAAKHEPRFLVEAAYERILARVPTPTEAERAVAWLQAGLEGPSASPSLELETVSLGEGLGQAVTLPETPRPLRLEASDDSRLPAGDFTVEVCFRLDSLYPDATVRTLVSHWDSQTQHRGWSLGVTSEKSKYEPRNLILQFVGDNQQGVLTYEVVASGLRPELGRTYYAAVAVRQGVSDKTGITFVLKDLDDPDAETLTSQQPHTVVGNRRPEFGMTFCVGGRSASSRHFWHGAIDAVSLSSAAVDIAELAPRRECRPGTLCWNFEEEPTGPFASSEDAALRLAVSSEATRRTGRTVPVPLVDLCHALLNSNELLYVE